MEINEKEQNLSKIYVSATIKKSIGPYENVELNIGISLPVNSAELGDLANKITEGYNLVETELMQKMDQLRTKATGTTPQVKPAPKKYEDITF